MSLLTREDLPCWYELSWKEDFPAILVRVHEDFIRIVGPVPQELPTSFGLSEELNLTNFVPNFEGNFGFNNALVRLGKTDGFVEFQAKIPQIRKVLPEQCGHCKGAGQDKDLKMKCSWCDGSGKKTVFDWQQAYELSASFTIFTAISYFRKETTSCSLPQFFTVRTITRRGSNGGALSGELSLAFANWLRSLGKDGVRFPKAINAMKIAYDRLLGLGPYRRSGWDFDAYADSGGWLIINCPGDACGIHPSGYYSENEGYEFDCHNVDSAAQQLTLLTALAVLHDIARADMAKNK